MTDGVAIYHGSEVLMHFTISLQDGTVAETTRGEDPLRFVMGDETLAEGLELALFGLKAGDRQSLKIGPETAYGYPDPENIQSVDRAGFPEDMKLERGVIVSFALPDGEEYPGMIIEVDDRQVMVDFNHPLSGHEILFEVEILEVVSGDEPSAMQ